MYQLDFDTNAVFTFMCSKHPFSQVEGMQCIGLRRDGSLIAGVMFEGNNGRNLWMHVAAEPSKHWLNRAYMAACFGYAFAQCGVDRVSGYVNESNHAARRFDEHIGFKEEARLKGAAPDGGDVLLYVMWKKDCKYVTLAHH